MNLAGLCDLVNMAEAHKVGSLVYAAWQLHGQETHREIPLAGPCTHLYTIDSTVVHIWFPPFQVQCYCCFPLLVKAKYEWALCGE